ncbi:MAG: NAD(P)/FAD-dependent oxidoreductase [Candidatus Marinimicrobia bacterium]|nr:NAD(P)/FAD-dependent oxidoreductase [Candidatus Neomarinimicrobiota bacterium]
MEKKYKLIIIGAGIAGLSTALAWNKLYNPEDVIVLEKNPIPGGCVTTFGRDGFRFDTTQIIPDVSNLLEFFDVEIKLKKFDTYYVRLFLANPKKGTVKIFPIASSKEDFQDNMIENFPEDGWAIKNFFQYCQEMHDELNHLKTEPKLRHIPGILLKCPKIIANSNLTYHQFLRKFNFKNPEVFQLLDTFSSFSGLSGDRCAALLTACAMITTLKGAYRPEKGFIQFPVTLKKKLESQGTEVRTHCEVQQILTKNGKVTGVRLQNGDYLQANLVVSTVDTKVTFSELLDFQKKDKYFRKVREIKISPSGFSIHLGLDDKIDLNALGFNCGYNVLTTPGAFEKAFGHWDRQELMMSNDCFHMAAICPSVMTSGKPTLVLHVVPVPSEKWIALYDSDSKKYSQEKLTAIDFYINKLEQYMVPELSRHVVFTDISTPATYRRYIGSPTGSQYDMLPVPSNFGKNRLKSRTTIKGLFITKFSHGIWPSMQAGLQIVDMISGGKIMNGNSALR